MNRFADALRKSIDLSNRLSRITGGLIEEELSAATTAGRRKARKAFKKRLESRKRAGKF